MNVAMPVELESWEGEGGAGPSAIAFVTGTASQLEWAERIRRQVNAEFDRVAAAFRSVARKQAAARRADTEAVIAILEDKRMDVISKQQAGYFIRDWQEIGDQVRQMIFRDARYQLIKSSRKDGDESSI